MAKARVLTKLARVQSSSSTDALHPLKTAQAAALLLHELHVGSWHTAEALSRDMDSAAMGLTPDELHTHLGYVAIDALINELDSVREQLEEAAVPKAVA